MTDLVAPPFNHPDHHPDRDISSLTLDELATRARYELRAAEAEAHGVLGHFLECGRILLAARELCPNGTWQRWLGTIGLDAPSASRMTRLAFYWDQIPDERKGVSLSRAGTLKDPSMGELLKSVAHLPPKISRTEMPRQYSSAVRAEVRRLRESGASWREIATLTNVPVGTARDWADPERSKVVMERRKARARAAAAARTAARTAEKRRERDRLAAESRQPSLAACYAMVRKLAGQIDAAAANLEQGPALERVRRAYGMATRCEADIVAALQLERQT